MSEDIREEGFDIDVFVGVVARYLEQYSSLDGGSEDLIKPDLGRLHPSDISDIYSSLSDNHRRLFFEFFGLEGNGEFITYLSDSLRDEIISRLSDDQLVELVSNLETDDVMDLVEDLSERERVEILMKLPRQERIMLERHLQFPEDTVGRLMRQETVTVPEYWNAGQTIDFIRSSTERLPELFYTIVVVDAFHRPLGNIILSDLLRSVRSVYVKELLDDRETIVSAYMDREDLAIRFRNYGLIEVSVVGDKGRLVGVVTVDDIIEVLHMENEEDVLQQHGLGDVDFHVGWVQASYSRLPWLVVNLFTSVLASIVIGYYSETIEAMVSLAVIMPIVVSMGGNGGMQALVVMLRGVATGDINSYNVWRVSKREIIVALFNGVSCGLLTGVIGYIWFGDWIIFVVALLSVILTLTVGCLFGIILPVLLEKMRMDPSVSSSIVLTTVTDALGFLSVLGLASLMI